MIFDAYSIHRSALTTKGSGGPTAVYPDAWKRFLCSKVFHKGGVEAAVHTMKKIFEDLETEAVILIDTSNAFNSINRKHCSA